VLETEKSILIFDYWLDLNGTGYESSWRMKEFTDEKGILFWEIAKEGETIEI